MGLFLSWRRALLKRDHCLLWEDLESRWAWDFSGTTRRSLWSWAASQFCSRQGLAWQIWTFGARLHGLPCWNISDKEPSPNGGLK